MPWWWANGVETACSARASCPREGAEGDWGGGDVPFCNPQPPTRTRGGVPARSVILFSREWGRRRGKGGKEGTYISVPLQTGVGVRAFFCASCSLCERGLGPWGKWEARGVGSCTYRFV